MAYAQQKRSEKLHLIDRATFEKIQQESNGLTSKTAIRNSKYKKTHSGERNAFNLLNFIKKPKTAKNKRVRVKSNYLRISAVKRRGKQREGGPKKKYSRLKKAILRYRLQKLQQIHTNINEVTTTLENLRLQSHDGVDSPSTAGNKSLHSRRFRSYCDNCTTPPLAELTDRLLRELYRFQTRAYAENEMKARVHRRLVFGFREVQNFLRINKVKLVLIAPDCETSEGDAGIDSTIVLIKQQCQMQNIPYGFSMRRRQLAHSLNKRVPVSCVAVLNYDGAREIFAEFMNALQEAKILYAESTSILPNT